jgi:hypothetical protein
MAVVEQPARRPDAPVGRRWRWPVVVLACVAVAALSLLAAHTPAYDATAWLIWGREIVHADLSTVAGPSWKPLPVAITTPLALTGDTAAPLLWLVIARTGGLLALVLAYKLAARLAGPAAGVIAVVGLLLEDVFVLHAARGNSEGIQVALALWAIDRHLDGRTRQAFLLALAGGLLRPEAWPLVAGYGLWLAFTRRERFWLVAAGGIALLAAWLIPEYLGSGDLLRAADRALLPVSGSPAQASFPFLAVFTNAARALIVPVYAGAVAAVVLAARRRDRTVLALAGLATAFMVSVGLGAEIGFTGNQRYVIVPAGIVAVLSGVGWAQLAGLVAARAGRPGAWALGTVAVLASLPFLVAGVERLGTRLDTVRYESGRFGSLGAAVDAAGGRAALTGCGPVYTAWSDTQAAAWKLHLHQYQVGRFPFVPGTTIAARNTALAHDSRFPPIARTQRWVIGSSCAR